MFIITDINRHIPPAVEVGELDDEDETGSLSGLSSNPDK